VRKPFSLDEVVARVVAKLDRPPVPVDALMPEAASGLLGPSALAEEIGREDERARRSRRAAAVAVLDVHERPMLRELFGTRAEDELALQVTETLQADSSPLVRVGRDEDGRFWLLLPEADPGSVGRRLVRTAEALAGRRLVLAGEGVQVTPVVGWVELGAEPTPVTELQHRARAA